MPSQVPSPAPPAGSGTPGGPAGEDPHNLEDPSGSGRRRDAPGRWKQLGRALTRGAWPERPAAVLRAWRELIRRQARAELWLGGRLVRAVDLEDGRYRIGRAAACELALEAPNLSRVHAILEKERDGDRDFTLADFDSANGVFHHDRRIRSIRLRDGDRVQFGSPLKGEAPTLLYRHPRSAFEELLHGLGIASLIGSGLLVGGLLLAASVSGGSRIRAISGPLKVYALDGRQIDAREGSALALPSLESYPLVLRQALLASEEARFGWNSGIDLFGTVRSLLTHTGGGSGLTQQVARLYYPDVGTDISLTRKLRELWVALQLEVGYSKHQILKMYLDRAHLGMGTDGFEQASRLYFRSSASRLDLPQSAFLVGLLPSPNGYSPCNRDDPTAGRERRDLVLKLMHEQGYIGDQTLIDARRRPLNIDASACRESTFSSYPFFSDYVAGELEGTRFGLNLSDRELGGNYAVIATIDPALQAAAQRQLKAFLAGPAARVGLTQGALITLDFRTGRILAYVGGGDYSRSSFDRVQALRQPGSTFKLFSYLTALEAGASPTEPISCAPLRYVAGCSNGPVGPGGSLPLADGLAYSENVVALRLAERVGLEKVLRRARQLGISTPLQPNYTMVLGGNETYLYEMARAYAVIANGGRSVPLHGVSRIYDLGICRSVYSLRDCPERGVTTPIGETPRQLVAPEIAARMDGLLRHAVAVGTARKAGVVADARGKTGTTNDGVDVLFVGYSPSRGLLTAIWMGNDDNRPADAASGSMAADLWGRYMAGLPARTG